MKKKIIAIMLLTGVTLAGCTRNPPSSPSVVVPPTAKEIFDKIEMFQGGMTEAQYFAKVETIATSTKTATTRKGQDIYDEGPFGSLFGMEYDYGYTNLNLVANCKIYANSEIKVCNIDEKTTVTDEETALPKIIDKKYVDQTYVANDKLINVKDDGTGSYLIPHNYQTISDVDPRTPKANLINFSLSKLTFGVMERFTSEYYKSKNFSADVEKLYTSEIEGMTTVNYLYYEEYKDDNGDPIHQAQNIAVSVSFKANGQVDNFKLTVDYYYLGNLVFAETIGYEYGYNPVEAYVGAKFDPSLYKMRGTIIPTLPEGYVETGVGDVLQILQSGYNGQISYGQPADREFVYFNNNELSDMQRYVYETNYSSLYSDGVLVSIVSGETRSEDYSYLVQTTVEDDKIYDIYKGHPTKNDYKVVTDMPANMTKEKVLSLSESRNLLEMNRLIGESDFTSVMGIMHHEPDDEDPQEYDSIYMQFARQQEGNTVAYKYEFEIGVSIDYADYDGITPISVSVLYSYMILENTYDWERYNVEQYIYDYYYYDLITSAEAKHVILKPEDFRLEGEGA